MLDDSFYVWYYIFGKSMFIYTCSILTFAKVLIGKLAMYQPRYMNGLFKKSKKSQSNTIDSEYVAYTISYNA